MHRGKKQPRTPVRPRNLLATQAEALEPRQFLSASVGHVVQPNIALQPMAMSSNALGYSPAQIRNAYGFNLLSGNGAGQTIAIVDAYNDAKIAADLATFDSQFGLPAPPSFKVVNQTGGSVAGVAADAGWAGETALDVEWAHAIAPGANVLLIEANSASLKDLLAGVDYARRAAGVSVVSVSWGGHEFVGQTKDDRFFTTPSGHSGVTFVAASGDTGSRFGVQWPASSPEVLSVGGTSLTTTGSAGAYSAESPWANTTHGYSAVEAEPKYQNAVQQSGARAVPDVSYDANPATGFAVYDSVPNLGVSGWQVFGGTSAGAPQWAALIAIADQARVAAKLGTLDGASQTLPAIYAPSADSATNVADYHDVTLVARHRWLAQGIVNVGYELQTGLGSPQAGPIVQTLSVAVGNGASQVTAAIERPSGPAPAGASAAFVATTAEGPISPSIAVPPSAGPVATSSVVQGTASFPTIFNDTMIHRGAAAPPGRSGAAIELTGLVSSPSAPAIAASTAVAGWVGRMDGSLVSWLTDGGRGMVVGSGIKFVPGANAGPEVLAGPREPVPSPAVVGSTVITALAAPLAAAPVDALYRFANFDPTGTFADAMSEFARESASITAVAPADVEHSSHRPWIITGIVLAVDAVLFARWYAQRSLSRKKSISVRTDSGLATNPESPQAGPLPTGL